MSQQQEPAQQQPTVRHIPIYVEGRSEPLVNTSPESQPSAHHHQPSASSSQSSAHHHPTSHHPTGMDSPGMDMPGQNDFFKQNSIFDRVRDIPVRSNFSNPFFKREPSPGAHRTSPFGDMGGHMPHTNVPHRGSSIPRQTPSPPTTNSWHSQPPPQQQQHHQHQQKPTQPSNAYQQQHAPQRPAPQQQQQQQPQPQHHPEQGFDQPDSAAKHPAKDDPIVKIQIIQKDVLAIFDQVEKFRGTKEGKKDKAYMYLDEMLTQNLLKLDSIDAGDQPQIKSARKEAIKSINTCIAVLEQKAEAGALESGSNASSSSLGGRNDSSNGIDGGVNGVEQQQQQQQSAADRSASNTSIKHSSSNSSQQHQQLQQ
ncbi:BAG domain-containing protein Samui-like [Anopheles albimanus]|uniref:BAG domain-containing protein Samui-like n=1 Tax=Anopheles albimanus TaxID=7167 RepID=UPI001641C025|nr:BAG domain-containing protein Samui-like [Anopheles albimanus]